MQRINEDQIDSVTTQTNYTKDDYPGSRNVADADQNLSLEDTFIQLKMPSLPRRIFSEVDITGATGGLFAIRQKNDTNDFELVRRNFNLAPSEPIKTGITVEALRDIESMYGRNGISITCNMIRSIANDYENKQCIDFLKLHCVDRGDITYVNGRDSEKRYFQLAQKVHECILEANSKNIRTFEGWCVLPYKDASAVSSVTEYIGGTDQTKHKSLFLSRVGLVSYYLNPDVTDSNVYVGLHDDELPGRSSAYFGNFASDLLRVITQESGQHEYYLYNRFGTALSPLHTEDNPMLFKFKVNKIEDPDNP